MNVALVIASLAGGGAERTASNLANWLSDRGDDVQVITLAPCGADRYPLHSGIKRVSLDALADSASAGAAVVANAARLRRLRRALRGPGLDAIVAMMSRVNVLTLLATRGLRCRVIVSERVYPPRLPLPALWSVARRLTYPWADAVVMQTRAGADWVQGTLRGARPVVIPNAIGGALADAGRRVHSADLFAAEAPLLLAVGRLEAQKGFDLLLSAFAMAHARAPAWRLVILGEGSLRRSLERQVRDLGLENVAWLPGWAGNVSEWYARADLFVLSSRFEGFPSVLGEAMAHGVPVVSFDCDTGPAELIRHQVDGLLVDAGNVDGLAAALGDLMTSEKRRARFGQRASEVCERFAEADIRSRWFNVIDG